MCIARYTLHPKPYLKSQILSQINPNAKPESLIAGGGGGGGFGGGDVDPSHIFQMFMGQQVCTPPHTYYIYI